MFWKFTGMNEEPAGSIGKRLHAGRMYLYRSLWARIEDELLGSQNRALVCVQSAYTSTKDNKGNKKPDEVNYLVFIILLAGLPCQVVIKVQVYIMKYRTKANQRVSYCTEWGHSGMKVLSVFSSNIIHPQHSLLVLAIIASYIETAILKNHHYQSLIWKMMTSPSCPMWRRR
jgi:hypothetical protein